jgi:hypothetical protein
VSFEIPGKQVISTAANLDQKLVAWNIFKRRLRTTAHLFAILAVEETLGNFYMGLAQNTMTQRQTCVKITAMFDAI